ncbi:MAG: RNA polymerase sigma factor [Ignavibacteriales bacterium]
MARSEEAEHDDQVFQELVREHYVSAYRAALAVLRDPDEALDAAQEAFVSAWRSLHQLAERRKAGPWIRRIAINAALAMIRKAWRTVPVDHVDRLVESDRGNSPEEYAIKKDEIERLAKGIRRLGHEDRVLLALHYELGLPYEDISEAMGIPVGTVGSRLSRVRMKLRRVLEDSSMRGGRPWK